MSLLLNFLARRTGRIWFVYEWQGRKRLFFDKPDAKVMDHFSVPWR